MDKALDDDAVLQCWIQLFTDPLLMQCCLSDAHVRLGDGECVKVRAIAGLHRQRLYALSWFMEAHAKNLRS